MKNETVATIHETLHAVGPLADEVYEEYQKTCMKDKALRRIQASSFSDEPKKERTLMQRIFGTGYFVTLNEFRDWLDRKEESMNGRRRQIARSVLKDMGFFEESKDLFVHV